MKINQKPKKPKKPKKQKENGKIQIVDSSGVTTLGEKHYIKFVIAGIVVLVVAVLAIFAVKFYSTNSNSNDSNSNSTSKNEQKAYKEASGVYQKAGIDYSYADFKKDQEAAKNNSKGGSADSSNGSSNVSSAAEQLEEQNNSKLKQQVNLMGVSDDKTAAKYDQKLLVNNIADQTKSMNSFIDNHLGWPESEYPANDYAGVFTYYNKLVGAMAGGDKPTNAYDDSVQTLDQQYAAIRMATFNNTQIHFGYADSEGYNSILSNWFKNGHPTINSSDIVTVSISDSTVSDMDGLQPSLEADLVSSNGIRYHAWIALMTDGDNNMTFKLLDIKEA
jgi:hypothetical protein